MSAEGRQISPLMPSLSFWLIKELMRCCACFFFVFFFWPFMSVPVLKNICYRLCKTVSAGMQWENPTNTSRRSSLLAVLKKGLLKTEKLLQLQCFFRLCVVHIQLKDHVFASALPAMSCIPASQVLHHFAFFKGSSFKNLTALWCCMCSMWFWLLQKAKWTFKVFLSSLFLCSTAGLASCLREHLGAITWV